MRLVEAKAPEYVQSGMTSVLGSEMWCSKLQYQSAGPDAGLPHSARLPAPKQEAGQADLLSLLFGMNQNAILKDVKENTKSIAARLAVVGWLGCSMQHESEEWKQ